MPRVGQARKRDAGEQAIVEALEAIGVLVEKISAPGFADLVCHGFAPECGLSDARRELVTVLLEVKSATGKATKAQIEKRADGWPVITVRSVSEALQIFGVQP